MPGNDGFLPWPRHPHQHAGSPLASIGPNQDLLPYTRGCQSVLLRQWPALQSCTDILTGALQLALNPRPPPVLPGDSRSTNVPALQPWAVPSSERSGRTRTTRQPATTATGTGQDSAYQDITFSGRMRLPQPSSLTGAQQSSARAPTPITVLCSGAPFHRFVTVHTQNMESASEGRNGTAMYQVRQPESKVLTLTSGTLSEVNACILAWPNTRVLAQLALGSLTAPRLGNPQPEAKSGAESVAQDRSWSGTLEEDMRRRLGPGAAAKCEAVLRDLGCWICSHITADPVGVILSGHHRDQGLWSSVCVSLRWCSEGAMEPLRTQATDRLWVQIQGVSRLLLVPPHHTFPGLAPFPAHHPYTGYSAPALAATARVPWPSRPHIGVEPTPSTPSSHEPATTSSHAPSQHTSTPRTAPLAPTAQTAPAMRTPPVGTAQLSAQHDASDSCCLEPQLPTQAASSPAPSTNPSAPPPAVIPHPGSEGPSVAYTQESEAIMNEVTHLWPDFAGVRGHTVVLHPGDAVWVPAGWWVHSETLFSHHHADTDSAASSRQHSASAAEPQATTSPAAATDAPTGDTASTSACGSPLTGNILLEVVFSGGAVGGLPHAVGALEQSVCELVEQWAVAAVGGKVSRVRAVLEDLADAWDEAAGAAAAVNSRVILSGAASSRPAAVAPTATTASQASDPAPALADWVSFPEGAFCTSATDSLTALAALRDSHWATGGDGSGDTDPPPEHEPSGGVSARGRYDPLDKDPGTLDGWRAARLGHSIRTVLGPLVALKQQSDSAGMQASCPPQQSPEVAGGGDDCAHLLRAMCTGRLVPTTWLNKLAHNESLLLNDKPYTYSVTYTEEEALFPELFKPQLDKREKRAHRQARDEHWREMRALTAASGVTKAYLTEQ